MKSFISIQMVDLLSILNEESRFERCIENCRILDTCPYFTHSPQSLCVSENYEIIKTRKDGHCMIHAWKTALEKSKKIQKKPFYRELCNSIYYELTNNINRYSSFVPHTTNIAQEVDMFLQHRNFASDVGDLVLHALANATEISAMVYKEDRGGNLVQSSYVEPINGQSSGLINLLKSGQHYDVIILENTGKAA